MKSIPRLLGFTGFILSAVTNTALLLGPLAIIAYGSYPVSIALRTPAWILTGRRLKRKLFISTGLMVDCLNALFYLLLSTGS